MQMECFECGSLQIVKDNIYYYCRMCGTVLAERMLVY